MLVCPLWQISSRKQLRCQCVRAKPVTLAFQPPVVIAVTSAAVCRGGLGACIGLVLACVGLCIELAFFSPRKSLQVFLLKTMCCFVSGSGSAAEVHCPSNESHVFPWAAKCPVHPSDCLLGSKCLVMRGQVVQLCRAKCPAVGG